jgi:hypothetical protein
MPGHGAIFIGQRQISRVLAYTIVLALIFYGFVVCAEKRNLAPPSQQDLEKSIQRGIEFLLKDQNKDGSWGTAHRTKDLNIFAPVPGAHHAFRSGVTALCVAALVETGAADKDADAKQALERGETWLLKNLPHLRRAETITLYNVWGHAYGIHALVEMYRRETQDDKRKQEIKEVMLTQIDRLQRYESVDGGWGYYDFRVGSQRPATDSTSFVTATVLIALREAKESGVEVPEAMVSRAIASLNRQRKSDHTYLYGEHMRYRPMVPINRPAGSLGRSQACNLALRVWGDKTITDNIMTNWLDRLVTRNEWLSFGRKRPIPHESWFQVAGYFFYYGHYYAALCIEELGGERVAKYKDDLAGILVPLQEKDGSWWDFPLYNYHQQYGTAFALMSLARCRK